MNKIVARLQKLWRKLLRRLGYLPPDPHEIGPDVIIENPTHSLVELEGIFGRLIIPPGKSARVKSPVVETNLRGGYIVGGGRRGAELQVVKWDALYVVKDAIKQFEQARALGEWDVRLRTEDKPFPMPTPLLSGLTVRRVKKGE